MATGIPGPRGANRLSYGLTYNGKRSPSEILGGPSASLDRVLSVPGNPTNRLVLGDNLPVMLRLAEDAGVLGSATLAYIDPPYATGGRFETRSQENAYEDLLCGANYLEFLRERVVLIRELLGQSGSLYVHLDANMAFPAKLVLDEIFGPGNFRNCITRKKCNPKNYTRNQYGNVSDYILFYSKTDEYVWNQPFDPWTEQSSAKEYQCVEENTGRLYKKVPVHAPGTRNGATGGMWRGKLPPPGKHWQYTPQKLDDMDANGEIYWSPTGNPRRKIYLDNSKGVPVQDIWMDFKDAHNQMIKITGYPTEKNSEMLRRIVRASSNPGDLVLDAFAGSGTTAVVSEEEHRRWIAIDKSLTAVTTIIHRLAQGSERMGDFVASESAFKVDTLFPRRILHSGLEVAVASSFDQELLISAVTDDWEELLCAI